MFQEIEVFFKLKQKFRGGGAKSFSGGGKCPPKNYIHDIVFRAIFFHEH